MGIEIKLLSETERGLNQIELDKEREKVYRLISTSGNDFRPNIHDYTSIKDNFEAAKTFVGLLSEGLGKLTEIIYAKDTGTKDIIGFLSIDFNVVEEKARKYYDEYKDVFESPESIIGNAHLTLLYVHPDHRQKKIATDLISAMEDLLKNKGINRVIARTMKESEEAQMFYDRIGYENLGEKPYDPYRIQFGYTKGTIWRAKNLQR